MVAKFKLIKLEFEFESRLYNNRVLRGNGMQMTAIKNQFKSASFTCVNRFVSSRSLEWNSGSRWRELWLSLLQAKVKVIRDRGNASMETSSRLIHPTGRCCVKVAGALEWVIAITSGEELIRCHTPPSSGTLENLCKSPNALINKTFRSSFIIEPQIDAKLIYVSRRANQPEYPWL